MHNVTLHESARWCKNYLFENLIFGFSFDFHSNRIAAYANKAFKLELEEMF